MKKRRRLAVALFFHLSGGDETAFIKSGFSEHVCDGNVKNIHRRYRKA
ncbi:hypothetical protein CHK_2003 [Christensenella hongkongensis]|uniref:Uncharacterized protein n=1 Tax=Christensenella hongkongensis TaxID=270498 RepID=A0A0M2NJD2_9FIRM|nr:hypothetical protein CHK_2003 [Christensenella hongkongensis]